MERMEHVLYGCSRFLCELLERTEGTAVRVLLSLGGMLADWLCCTKAEQVLMGTNLEQAATVSCVCVCARASAHGHACVLTGWVYVCVCVCG